MSIIYLLCILMIVKAVEIRLHLYLPSKDAYLVNYRKDFIIYDANGFLKFLSYVYAIAGVLFMSWSMIASIISSYATIIIHFGLVLMLVQIILTSIGKKYFKKRFS
ncbi:hypothetical protein KHM83_12100 [Fusibacter paucivorans]|uniref:SdpI/YhfL protein family protein n=1 Tax=Fusibacter paucivorans TaxID=76009 RepID=A0ABS5PTQ0_9FIRM|nr:hypothetical protein [Fusibacter paucivorans]MBS7527417.1 hypothetical protein [Fusibacter paucivorans]